MHIYICNQCLKDQSNLSRCIGSICLIHMPDICSNLSRCDRKYVSRCYKVKFDKVMSQAAKKLFRFTQVSVLADINVSF